MAPGAATRAWFGHEDAALRVTLRSIGARDLALGAGLLTTSEPTPWLWAGALVDLVDAVASGREIGPIPAAKLAPGTALAAGFAAIGIREAHRRRS